MTTFEEMAKAAQARSLADTEALAAEKRRKENEDKERVREAVALLEDNVMPVMFEAQLAFQRLKIPCTIESNWDKIDRFTVPKVVMKLKGPATPMKAMGGSYEPEGVAVIAKATADKIEIRFGRHVHDKHGQEVELENWRESLNAAIEKSVQSYYDSIEKMVRMYGE